VRKKREGVALIWVVLMSALILVSIIGISIKVVPEKQILNARAYSQRVLAVAETGLAKVVYQIRTDEGLQTSLASLATGSNITVESDFDSGIPSVTSAYKVEIVKEPSDEYSFYSMGVVYKGSTKTEANVIARKVIKVKYAGYFPFGDYALFSCGGIDAQNGTVDGSIFANEYIDFTHADLTGTAYCPANDFTGIPEDQQNPNCKEIGFPSVELNKYRDLWTAFLNGSFPYCGPTDIDGDGNVDNPDYPDTSTPKVHTYIFNKLKTTSDPATQDDFESFFDDLRNPASPEAAYLSSFLSTGKLVFDVQPDLHKNIVDFSGSLYTSQPYLQGIIVIEGDLKFSSDKLQIGVDPYKTSILVTGAVTVSNACTINGLLYIAGTDKKALSISASGGLTCNGSIVAIGEIDLNSDKLVITRAENEIYKKEIKPSILEEQKSKLSPVPSSWQEVSYDEFQNP